MVAAAHVPKKEDGMAEFMRVATFEADAASLDALVSEISSHEGPPDGIPAKRITVLADRAAGKVVVAVRFGSEDDLQKGSAALAAMSPPDSGMRRVSVDSYEIVLERNAP
jgi:hypothetical protein